MESLRTNLNTQATDVSRFNASIESKLNHQKQYLENLSNALIAEKVEQLTKDKQSEQEKCIAIAQWIAANISNLSAVTQANSDQEVAFITYMSRQGLCGDRAVLFAHMLNIIGIHARVFNIFNHPAQNNGHTCTQVFYNNSWHFFDVTFAGYFEKDGYVMSWHEICEKSQQQNHMQSMVVFEKTCDLNQVPMPKQPINSQVTFHNNYKRMQEFYVDIHKSLESSGFYKEDLKKIFIDFNLEQVERAPYILGDKNWSDYSLLTAEGAKKSLSVGLGTIGNADDYFKHIWQFRNLELNTRYAISFSYYNDLPQGFRFFAEASNGVTILQGKQADPTTKVWKIVFTSYAPNAVIEIFYERENDDLIGALLLNQIKIEKIN